MYLGLLGGPCSASKTYVAEGEIAQALVIVLVIIARGEGCDLHIRIAGQVTVFQEATNRADLNTAWIKWLR
jgi:hypothetical protein